MFLFDIICLSLQIFKTHDGNEAPSGQIYTGQTGTSQIPDAMDVGVEFTLASKASVDSVGLNENDDMNIENSNEKAYGVY